MNKTLEKDVNLLEAAFYSKPYSFSFTSLNKLIDAPNVFYKEYILKEREDVVAKYLLEGVLIHYLVLDGLDFDSKFIVCPEALPPPNTIKLLNRLIISYGVRKAESEEEIYLADFETEILEYLVEVNLHQALKDDAGRLKKILDTKTMDYFEFLKTKNGRTIIDGAMLDKCSRRADLVKQNTTIRNLLGMNQEHNGATVGIYNELELSEDAEKYPFGFKGVLDNLVVDVVNKKIYINDFKTTSKRLSEFEDSIEHWNYWLQAVIYKRLAYNFLKDVVNDDWNFEFRFIVFDKHDQLYPFPVTGITMEEWERKAETIFNMAEYHYTIKDFELPHQFALGNVKL